jgi:hypothetical protein
MKSLKTLVLDTTKNIVFIYIDAIVYITITIDLIVIKLVRWEDDFISTLDHLQSEYLIPIHSINKIKNWYSKNTKKYYPISKYTTKYGRTILYK